MNRRTLLGLLVAAPLAAKATAASGDVGAERRCSLAARTFPPCTRTGVSRFGYCARHATREGYRADVLVDPCVVDECPYVAIDTDRHCWAHRHPTKDTHHMDIVWTPGMTVGEFDDLNAARMSASGGLRSGFHRA